MFHTDKHLTNVAVNINAPTYVKWIGGKWFLDNLKLFMLSKYNISHLGSEFKKQMKLSQTFRDALLNHSEQCKN